MPSNSNLKSIEEIPFYNLDGSYGTSYYPEGRLILITFDCKNAIFEYCLEVEDLPPQEDIEFLRDWFEVGESILLGFETEVFINNTRESIENVISDQGPFPVLLIRDKQIMEFGVEGEWGKYRIQLLKDLINPLI